MADYWCSAKRFLVLLSLTGVWVVCQPLGYGQQLPGDEPQAQLRDLVDTAVSCPSGDQLKEWFKPLSEIKTGTYEDDDQLPIDCSENLFTPASETGGVTAMTAGVSEFHWQPTELGHQPLYFDDVPLERYGQSRHPLIQPVVSGARFFLTFPVIPYKIGIDRTHDCISTLGYHRPGTCTPCTKQTLPLEMDAATLEAGAWVAALFIFP